MTESIAVMKSTAATTFQQLIVGIEKDFAPLAGEKHCTHDLQFDGSAGSLDFCTKTVEDFAKVKFRIKDVSSGTDVSEYNSACG